MRYSRGEQLPRPHHWRYEEVCDDLGLIRVGDIVTSFDSIEDLDEFVPSLLSVMSNSGTLLQARAGNDPQRVKPIDLDSRGRHRHRDWLTLAKLPSIEMRPKKVRGISFTGSFTNITAALVNDAFSNPTRIGGEQAELVLDADLTSTGRGTIGRHSG